MLDEIVTRIEDRTARGIAAGVSRMITAGDLPAGERLPTVRALARALAVSPTTVSDAWQALGEAGAIETRGRLGSFVIGPGRPSGPRRYRSVTDARARFRIDLSTGTPDPALLPDLSRALGRVSRSTATTNYLDDPVLPILGEAIAADWPFTPEAVTVTDGALDAMDRLITELVRFGDRVVVENPTFPPILDLLELAGAEVIGVPGDAEGVLPDALADALRLDPVLFITQPRAHNPLGVATTARRAKALAALLGPGRTIIIEDDHASAISTSRAVTVGTHLPDRTVLVRSFSKTHGPDLRLAAVGGAAGPIEALDARRTLGAGWSSRLLQAVLAELLRDRGTARVLRTARDEYRARRAAAADALAAHGIATAGGDGINLWVPVPDERAAQLGLAARGIGVAPGSPFLTAPVGRDHLRLTIATLVDPTEVADALAAAIEPVAGARR